MLQQWLHAQTLMGSSLAQRLLSNIDGERRINNLLHLGELLQHAGTRLSGCLALVRYLGEQIQSSTPPPESAHMRLESDAQRVQIITYHKSKGLEYPWVWVPFLSSFGKPADNAPGAASLLDAESPGGDAEVGSDEICLEIVPIDLRFIDDCVEKFFEKASHEWGQASRRWEWVN
jgi:ATP-dependent exoDNAse (exonuclease V) beta subunit